VPDEIRGLIIGDVAAIVERLISDGDAPGQREGLVVGDE
jgi:hypothetical protein